MSNQHLYKIYTGEIPDDAIIRLTRDLVVTINDELKRRNSDFVPDYKHKVNLLKSRGISIEKAYVWIKSPIVYEEIMVRNRYGIYSLENGDKLYPNFIPIDGNVDLDEKSTSVLVSISKGIENISDEKIKSIFSECFYPNELRVQRRRTSKIFKISVIFPVGTHVASLVQAYMFSTIDGVTIKFEVERFYEKKSAEK